MGCSHQLGKSGWVQRHKLLSCTELGLTLLRYVTDAEDLTTTERMFSRL